MTAIYNKLSLVTFPIHIVNFNGKVDIENSNVTWISSRLRKFEYPHGITVILRNNHGSNPEWGYAKWFEIYSVERRARPDPVHGRDRTYIWSKFILRSYRSIDRDTNDCSWRTSFYGDLRNDNIENVMKTKEAIMDYMENFKLLEA